MRQIRDLPDLNARLWAWLEQVYHACPERSRRVRPHAGLDQDTSPLQRYQRDLVHVRPLGAFAPRIDELFYHRDSRKVRKDGTVSFANRFFEVPYELVGRTVMLVTDPHQDKVLFVESTEGEHLGPATPLDAEANSRRKRQRAAPAADQPESVAAFNAVGEAYRKQIQAYSMIDGEEKK